MKASTVCAVLCSAGLLWGTTLVLSSAPASRASIPNDDKTIGHVLNRVGFGTRPGDVERVRAMGVERYIDEQLHPERISDRDVESRLTSREE